MKVPKVLVISNECFSKTSSNGRTLGNFFDGWPKDCLAQFFLSGIPDNSFCEHFFQVSDHQAFHALFSRQNIGGVIHTELQDAKSEQHKNTGVKNHIRRNAISMLARNALWQCGAWQKSGYWKWAEAFRPEIVLLQAGDCAFMFRLAMKTANRLNAKLVIYNSEGYYYKKFDYFRGKGVAHLAYPIFRKQLKNALKKAYHMASCVIYVCNELKAQYAKDFSGMAETIFTGSDVRYEKKKKQNDVFTTVYCGNLGLNRHESLIDVAEALQSISKDLYIDVYGKTPNADVKQKLEDCCGIRYHGVVPYETVRNLLRDSDLLLYVESFEPFYQMDVEFGFSTKIADSLSSGNCFLLYAPEHFACSQYLRKNQVAYTVSDKAELKKILKDLVENPDSRCKYQEAAIRLAEENHRIEKNTQKFQKLLRKLVK